MSTFGEFNFKNMKDKLLLSHVFDNNYVRFRIDHISNELTTLHLNKEKIQLVNQFIIELKELSNQTNDQEDIINISFALMDCYFALSSPNEFYNEMLKYENKVVVFGDDIAYYFYKDLVEKLMQLKSYENAIKFYIKAKEFLFKCNDIYSEEYGDLATIGAKILLKNNYNEGLIEIERILNDERSQELSDMDRSNIYYIRSLFKMNNNDFNGAEMDKKKAQFYLDKSSN